MKSSVALIAFLAVICTVGAQLGLPLPVPTVTVLSDMTNMLDLNGTRVDWPDIMYFPDDNGEPMAGKINGRAAMDSVEQTDVFFKLFTRNEPTEGTVIILGNANSLRESTFNASEPTFFVTHGFLQSIDSNTINTMKNTYVAHKRGNVIAVDWSKISKNWLYFIVKKQTVEVGQFVAAFIAFLVNSTGVDVADVHLAGHSLGAHVMGIAGKNVHAILGKKVARITGLDPAGPLFSVLDKQRRLDRDDADFVDVIHTCGGWLGMYPAIGHADFYPNGGKLRQPGCAWDFVSAGTCSHSRSWEFFAESINPSQAFSSRACAMHASYLTGNCTQSPVVPMGHRAPNSTRGIYYLQTAENSPYSKG